MTCAYLKGLVSEAKDLIAHAKACTAKGNRYPRLHSMREEGNRNALLAYQKAVALQEKIIADLTAQLEGKK